MEGSPFKDSNECMPRKRGRPRKIKITRSCGRPRKDRVLEVEITFPEVSEGFSTPPIEIVSSSMSWESKEIITRARRALLMGKQGIRFNHPDDVILQGLTCQIASQLVDAS